MPKRLIKKAALLAVCGWFAFCGIVYFFPQYIYYNPNSEKAVLSNAVENGFAAEEVRYEASDKQKLYGWYVEPTSKHKVVVFFHGNSHNIESFYHKLVPLADEGYGVFIGEYRGFGGINGEIKQKNLEKDAVAAVNYLYSLGFKNNDLILYGMSLGSHMAVYTAGFYGQKEPFFAIILEVPFDSLINVVKQRIWPVFPFNRIVKDIYDNTVLISQIKSPVLIMAGTRDKTVPQERAKALFAKANEPKKLIVYSGAEHSSLYNYRNWKDIINWLRVYEKNK